MIENKDGKIVLSKDISEQTIIIDAYCQEREYAESPDLSFIRRAMPKSDITDSIAKFDSRIIG